MKKTTVVDGKHMRLGFTTGTCVVAAAKAAIEALKSREAIHAVQVTVPAGMCSPSTYASRCGARV